MIGKLRGFSNSKLAGVLVGIIIIPFVFNFKDVLIFAWIIFLTDSHIRRNSKKSKDALWSGP